MLKRIFLFISISFLLSGPVLGQSKNRFYLGAQGGFSLSSIRIDESPLKHKFHERISYQGGFNLEYQFPNHLFAEYELGIIAKNYRQEGLISMPFTSRIVDTESYGGYKDIHRRTYLQQAMNIGYWFGNKLAFAPVAGFYFDTSLKYRVKSKDYTYISEHDWNEISNISYPKGYYEETHIQDMHKEVYNKVDYGLNFGAYFAYRQTSKMAYTLKLNYQYGLNNLRIDPTSLFPTYYNSSFNLSLGIKYQL